MINKLLKNLVLTSLFIFSLTTTTFALSINLDVDKDNNSIVTVNNIEKDIYSLQIDLVDANGSQDYKFVSKNNFSYEKILKSNLDGKTKISILIDNSGNSISGVGSLSVGTLVPTDKPNFENNFKVTLVYDNLKSQVFNVDANINYEEIPVPPVEEEKPEEPTPPAEESKPEETPVPPVEEEKPEEPTPPAEESKPEETPVPPVEEEKPEEPPVPPVEEEKPEETPVPPVEEEKPEETPVPPVEEEKPEETPVPPVEEEKPEEVNKDFDISLGGSTSTGVIVKPIIDKDGNVVTESQLITSTELDVKDLKIPAILENKVVSFNDIANTKWAEESIQKLAKAGIINGDGQGGFNPNGKSKRADVVIMLVKLLGLDGVPTSNFEDVSKDKYYYNYVGLAKHYKIINGNNGKFNPESNITRQDTMIMISNILKELGLKVDSSLEKLNNFTDFNEVSSYAIEGVAILVNAGIINGNNGKLYPKDEITRAEMSVIISKIYDLILEQKATNF